MNQRVSIPMLVLATGLLAVVACSPEADADDDIDAVGQAAVPTPTEAVQETPTPTEIPAAPTPAPEPTPVSTQPPDASDDDADRFQEPELTPANGAADDPLAQTSTYFNVAQGPDGEYYVVYSRHGALLTIASDGELVDAWRIESDGPRYVATGGGDSIYVAESRRVERFSLDGTHEGVIRKDEFLRGEFLRAYAMASDPEGNLYMSHANEDHITRFGPDGEFLDEIPEARRDGQGGPGSVIDFDAEGRIYLMAWEPPGTYFIEVRDQEGDVLDSWDIQEATDDDTNDTLHPVDMAVAPDGRVTVLFNLFDHDSRTDGPGPPTPARDYLFQVYASDGELEQAWRAIEDTDLEEPLYMPSRYIVDQDGVIVLPDAGPNSHRIQRFTLEGEFLEEWRHDVPDYLCGRDREFDQIDCDGQTD